MTNKEAIFELIKYRRILEEHSPINAEPFDMAIDALRVLADTISKNTSQEAKADAGKPDLTLVPRQIIWDVAEVREYGNRKYHSPDNWKQVDVNRYRAAAFRHFLAYLDNPHGKDAESGIEHYKHLACNIAFICELEGDALVQKITEEIKSSMSITEKHILETFGGKTNERT